MSKEKTTYSSTEEVIRAFSKGKYARMPDRRGMFGENIPNGTMQTNSDSSQLLLYNYWCLAVRVAKPEDNCGVRFVINGDQEGHHTTAKLQRRAIQVLPNNIQIPFSALGEAGIDLRHQLINGEVKIIDYAEDRWVARPDSKEGFCYVWVGVRTSREDILLHNPNLHRNCLESAGRLRATQDSSIITVPVTTTNYVCSYCMVEWNHYGDLVRDHYLGMVLLEAPGGLYLSGFDNNEPRRHYFLTRLADGCNKDNTSTVEAAIESLKPLEVKKAEREGLEVVRQGDLFFIKGPDYFQFSYVGKKVVNRQILGSSHYGSTVRQLQTNYEASILSNPITQVVRGVVRHKPNHQGPRHHKLKLGDGKSWWIVVKNTATGSWEAQGNAD